MRLAPPYATILVGEAPSATSDPLRPLISGRSGRFLAELAGIELFQLETLFRCINLLNYVPREGRGKRRAMGDAGAQLRPALDGRRVIALGRRVASALRLEQPFWEWRDVGLFDALLFPHPSGESRMWGSAQVRARAEATLRAEAARAAEGCLAELPEGVTWPWLARVVAQAPGAATVPG